MKKLRIVGLLLAAPIIALMLPSIARGQTDKTQGDKTQTEKSRAANDIPAAIAGARCQYTPAEEACLAPGDQERQSSDAATVAQIPRRIPGPPSYPHHPPMGRPGYGYPGYWTQAGDSRHAAIGALIGLGAGVGLAVGAYSDPNKRVVGSLIFGGFGALIGAVVGRGIPAYHRRRPWDDEDGEDASVKYRKPAATDARAGS